MSAWWFKPWSFFEIVKTWPFKRLSDLQLGDPKVTLNHLVGVFICSKISTTIFLRDSKIATYQRQWENGSDSWLSTRSAYIYLGCTQQPECWSPPEVALTTRICHDWKVFFQLQQHVGKHSVPEKWKKATRFPTVGWRKNQPIKRACCQNTVDSQGFLLGYSPWKLTAVRWKSMVGSDVFPTKIVPFLGTC